MLSPELPQRRFHYVSTNIHPVFFVFFIFNLFIIANVTKMMSDINPTVHVFVVSKRI